MRMATRETGRTGPPSVAMLTWEINPMVAGGSWTACYHFVRSLRKRKTKLMVVAPWREDCVDPDPFGCKVPTALLGILGHDKESALTLGSRKGSYRRGPADGSQYGAYRPYAPYGYGGGSYRPFRSGYGYGGYTTAGQDPDSEAFFDFMREASDLYTERLLHVARKTSFALIHAQDWVTFQAAAEVSRTFHTRWIAHFHSIERDRRPWAPDATVERIERSAAHSADFIVTPSRLTARCVAEHYEVPISKIVVVPNVLSNAPTHPVSGMFDSRRVVFLGRLESQKAPDRFAQVAARVRERDNSVVFRVFGDGQLRDELARDGSRLEIRGPLCWNRRWSAFDGTAAVLVPSRAEPFGMVVLEAMQCGVPVLYSSEAGVAEVIRSGIPIHANDVEGTADRVLELLADPVLWENVAEAERQEIRSYPERGYERRLLKLYAEL